MADQPITPPIIVIKKKYGHAAHHGGAWKVAYADFVTAMMALFIVLWLMNASQEVQKAVSVYFSDPSGLGKLQGSAHAGAGDGISLSKDDMKKLQEKIEQAMKKTPEFEKLKEHVRMTVTGEGLRIELLESDKGLFFTSGSAVPSNLGTEMLGDLAKELGKIPNTILLEGHTDSKPYSGDRTYSNWELSADRANAARRFMESNGLRNGQVVEVRGFADRRLRNPADSLDPSNRRITLIIKYLDAPSEIAVGKGAGNHGEARGKPGETHRPGDPKPHALEAPKH